MLGYHGCLVTVEEIESASGSVIGYCEGKQEGDCARLPWKEESLSVLGYRRGE